jgi:outer membrane protein assembly factor BamD
MTCSVSAKIRLLSALTALLALSSCGLLDDTDETVAWSANKLYSESRDALDDGNYSKAIKYFEKLEARYPYGSYAQQAQLDIAYAYFKDNDATNAVTACDRFIKLHPNHPNVDYAFYLKGLVNFNENTGLFGGFTKENPAERDPKAARDSFDAFKELVTRFPNSKYTPDALYRMKYLVNSLASHEIIVARWYMRLGAYVAANNRAQYAIKTYPETPSTEEALALMVGAYDGMKIDALRDDAKRVLQSTYPKSSFLQRGSSGHWKTLWN